MFPDGLIPEPFDGNEHQEVYRDENDSRSARFVSSDRRGCKRKLQREECQ